MGVPQGAVESPFIDMCGEPTENASRIASSLSSDKDPPPPPQFFKTPAQQHLWRSEKQESSWGSQGCAKNLGSPYCVTRVWWFACFIVMAIAPYMTPDGVSLNSNKGT